MTDLYASATDPAGRFGAVFESDEQTAYFYLLDMRKPEGTRIIAAFNAAPIAPHPADIPISITWNASATAAGLFVNGALSILFDLRSSPPAGRFANPEDSGLFLAQ